jgi:UDPglucose 6-dehydrogenase
MRIAIAGTGYVGLVTGVCLAEMGYEVICVDIQKDKIAMLQSGKIPIYEPGLEPLLKNNLNNGRLQFTVNPQIAYSKADIIFIAVGTPQKHDGSANLDYIYETANSIGSYIENDVIVCTKSTVPVGTNEQIKQIIQSKTPSHFQVEVVSNPEFLREGSAIDDFFNGDRIVIGANSDTAASTVERVFLPLRIPIIKTDIRSAEMIKYASNAFLATKISFINEIAALCEKVGANVENVANGIGSDHRIGHHFLQAGIGYGGSCFPKDTKALVQLAGNVQHHFELLEAVIKVNNRQRAFPVEMAKETIGSLKGKKVALLGLAFKPNTDDVREAASLTIIKKLLEEEAEVTAYDPIAIQNTQKVLGNLIEYTDDIRVALLNAEVAIIATEWNQIKQVPLNIFPLLMKNPVVIDGRNCFPIEEIKNYPITYFSVGRPAIFYTDEPSKIN